MAKFCVDKASKEVILRKSILSMFVVSMFLSAYAEESINVEEQIEADASSAIDLSKVVVNSIYYSQAMKDALASISAILGEELTDQSISELGPALENVGGVSVKRAKKSVAHPIGFGDVDTNFISPISVI